MKDKLLIERIKSKISKSEIVSFDIFDTLLVRPYVKPTDLFVHIEKAYGKTGFADERKDAERRARLRHKDMEDITFDMIYDEIDDEFKDMKQKEMDWEEMVLRANPELKQVYDYVKAQNKKIIITSDMYLPSEFLAKVLRKNGFDGWEKLYVSGEVGKKKRSGSLYYHILDDLQVSSPAILHVGDNAAVDYDVAKVIGFKAQISPNIVQKYIAKNKKACVFFNQFGNVLGGSILVSVLAYRWTEQRCQGHTENYWDELGYQYSGPLAYSFMRWLERETISSHIEHLLFVMRSGFVLKKVFDTFEPKIKTSYVYAPRVLKALCHLSIDYKEDYIKFIEYFAQKSSEIQKRFKLITDRRFDNLKLFFNTNRKLFEEVAEKNKAYYLNYLTSVCSKEENIAIVDDMAANFSAQFLIEDAVGKSVPGFYFAHLSLPKYNNFSRKSFAETYTSKKLLGNEADVWSWKWRFVEFLMGCPEFPVENINEDGIVLLKNVSQNELLRSRLSQNLVDNAVMFAQDMQTLFCGNDIFIDFPTIVKWINCFLNFPNKNDYKKMSCLSYDWKTFNTDVLDFLVHRPRLKEFLFSVDKYKRGMNGTFFWPSRHKGLLYAKTERENKKTIKILGLPWYSRIVKGDKIKTKKYFGLIKCSKNSKKKKIYILGVCVFRKKVKAPLTINNTIISSQLVRAITSNVQRALTVAVLHQKTFGEFRNKHADQVVVLIGAGPTVKFWEPLKNVIYVGLNRAFLFDKIHFDYLFSIDKAGLDMGKDKYYEGFINYDCIKFMGDQHLGKNFQIPQHIFYQGNNIRRYKTTAAYLPNCFAFDLETEALGNYASVALQAMQFILYTNPKKVYVVGIDCTNASKQHFAGGACDNSSRKENLAQNDKTNIEAWKNLREFVATYYPETEIISVNPVGLKGLFHDVYTRSYLDRHPEIDVETVEILEEKE